MRLANMKNDVTNSTVKYETKAIAKKFFWSSAWMSTAIMGCAVHHFIDDGKKRKADDCHSLQRLRHLVSE